MTPRTDSVAVHTLDSDLIDEPAPANAAVRTHARARARAEAHQSGGHGDPIIIAPAVMAASDIGRQWRI